MEHLRGGKGDGMKPSDFNPHQFSMGMRVEREHTPNPAIRKEISADHLVEDPKYYTHLNAMERKYGMYHHAYAQGSRSAKIAFQLTDDDKSLGDKITPFLGAVDPTPFGIGTGVASAALAPEGAKNRLSHGAGGMLGAVGGQTVGALGGGLLGAILGLPVGALLGLKLPKAGLPPGVPALGGAATGAIAGAGLGALGGSLVGGYKGTQLGRRLAGGEKKKEEKPKEEKKDKE